jgi:hypothetical protein
MREFRDAITGKDKDDNRDHEADKKPAPALERASDEPEVVTADAPREDRPTSRAES